MKKLIYVVTLIALTSCNPNKSDNAIADRDTCDSIMEEPYQIDIVMNDSLATQADINTACINDYLSEEDYVNNEFRKLLEALPKYRKVFLKEKALWEKYHEAVHEVSLHEDHGSSTPMYVSAVLSQGIQVQGESQHYLYQHTLGKEIPYSKTVFTSAMIADAYSAFIIAVGEDEYDEQRTEYQKSIRKEQRCWGDLLEYRNKVSQVLTGDIKKMYDIGTNQMIRTKLRQLKNQNRDLGLTSDENIGCALPEDCSDKALLDYPGYDVIWAKHDKDRDWYPTFD